MKHPMPRNRRKLKLRAARWKASKEDTYEVAFYKRVYGYNLITGSGGPQPKGILST